MHTKKSLLATAIVAAMACVSFSASAQTSAVMKVTATITPSACTIALSQSAVDKGSISALALHETQHTEHGGSHPFSVTTKCDALTSTYIKFIDNRAGTASESGGHVLGANVSPNSEQIGNYSIGYSHSSPVTYDGTAGVLGASSDNQTWEDVSLHEGKKLFVNLKAFGARTAAGVTQLVPAKDVVYPLVITPLRVNSKDNLTVDSEIKADGQFTVELHTI